MPTVSCAPLPRAGSFFGASRHEAAAALECVAEGGSCFDPFRFGVDVGEANVQILGPVGNKAPAQQVQTALSGFPVVTMPVSPRLRERVKVPHIGPLLMPSDDLCRMILSRSDIRALTRNYNWKVNGIALYVVAEALVLALFVIEAEPGANAGLASATLA